MTRFLGSTAILLAITFASKLIGFVRELILLESLGIGAELDVFVILYGLVGLMSGALGICIVTSLTPIAGKFRTRANTIGLMAEGLRAGMAAGAAALALCLIYVAVLGTGGTSSAWQVALVVPFIVPFSLLAEYQVALFLSRNQRMPVIAGNLIISLPLVAALLIFDLGIVTYAIGLAASFIFRAVIFAALLMGSSEGEETGIAAASTSLFGARLGRTLAGGSAMLAISAIAISAPMAARELGEGQATVIAYGLKVPQLIITSIWFVLGTGFFAQIVTRGTHGSKRQIAIYTAFNFAIFAAIMAGTLLLGQLADLPEILASSQLMQILLASAPFLPLIALTPLIEMSQRLLATVQHQLTVLAIAASILIGGLAAQGIALATGSAPLLALSPAIAGGLGAIAACVIVSRLNLSATKYEASHSNAPA
ncbi:hypothetical protein [Qipengyuania sp. ASV99]|uniref:hypothetical protein n=1 Tax=Qipengyuania sp. ASV99 TaxID=3399681 RepID=UPI003A4C825B